MEGRGKGGKKEREKEGNGGKTGAYQPEGNDQMLYMRVQCPCGKIMFKTYHKQVSKSREENQRS